jgi:hypothetical protein
MVPLPPLPSRLFAPIPLCTDWRALCPDLGRWFASRLRGWPPVDGAVHSLPLLLLTLLLTLLLLTVGAGLPVSSSGSSAKAGISSVGTTPPLALLREMLGQR